ncbi:creatininase family protein [Rhodobacter sp. NTK016B]|uniref:creatininase family protein n=1 Tax=Rhodobacter sp. NTK016B TaxID=2759676 RepID=UPI001A8D6417|nr:creatininase family protein [Rhodobacter sp. NTK016B]MBN8291845.1 creatininase family protein [Rhodobacter sp. NTK016B]
MSTQGYWAKMPAPTFLDLPEDTIAVLPLGATEQHGPHLPLSVDTDIIGAVTARMLTHLMPEQSVLVLPTLSITKSDEHLDFPGTLSLSGDSLLSALKDIGSCVARAGVNRLVLFNGHGGNAALLQVAARALRRDHNLIVVLGSWSGLADWTGWDADALAHDIHAGESETSVMLAIAPDDVAMDRARNFRSALDAWQVAFPQIGLAGKPMQPGWLAQDLHPDGACGNAAAASATAGGALVDSSARGFARFLAAFATFDHRRPPA